jgi:hypothetical protein
MITQKTALLSAAAILIVLVGFFAFYGSVSKSALNASQAIDPTPKPVTLAGTFGCLQHTDTTGPQTMECAFGFQTDDGVWYAVSFGDSADAMNQFQSGAHVTADGNVVPKEALSTNHWDKYQMVGIFTITYIHPNPAPQGKINIDAVCEGALAYMSFPDGESAAAFVAECKDGKHPEVIEQYKAQMGVGGGAEI